MLPYILTLLLSLPLALAGTYTQIQAPFGPNPRNVTFQIYIPTTLAARPPILVFPHWCGGTALAAYQGSIYPSLAEQYGFLIIYPETLNEDKCWDVSSPQTLSHDGGGDSLGIVSMVRYSLDRWNGDAARVFVSGVSSGAMMTNVLLGAYPDVFAAGAVFAGVPFGCFAGTGYGEWSAACVTGQIRKSGADWAAQVRAAYPEYNGWRPKVQVYHGTADEVLDYANYEETVQQWTSVLDVSETPASVVPDTPVAGWTKSVYRNGEVEGYSAAGVTHDIKIKEENVMEYFDLRCVGEGQCFKRPDKGARRL